MWIHKKAIKRKEESQLPILPLQFSVLSDLTSFARRPEPQFVVLGFHRHHPHSSAQLIFSSLQVRSSSSQIRTPVISIQNLLFFYFKFFSLPIIRCAPFFFFSKLTTFHSFACWVVFRFACNSEFHFFYLKKLGFWICDYFGAFICFADSVCLNH